MRICAFADVHGSILPDIPDCDLLLICGDITPFGRWNVQLAFLNGIFREWLEKLEKRGIPVVGVAGNHDTLFSWNREMIPQLPWIYLEDSGVEIKGLKIYGTPWVLTYGPYAFMQSEEFLAERFDNIPEGTDIVVTHGPPYGYGDGVLEEITDENEHLWPKTIHQGSKSLLDRLKVVKPRLCVYGHLHNGRGLYYLGENTILANVAIMNDGMQVVHEPMMILI